MNTVVFYAIVGIAFLIAVFNFIYLFGGRASDIGEEISTISLKEGLISSLNFVLFAVAGIIWHYTPEGFEADIICKIAGAIISVYLINVIPNMMALQRFYMINEKVYQFEDWELFAIISAFVFQTLLLIFCNLGVCAVVILAELVISQIGQWIIPLRRPAKKLKRMTKGEFETVSSEGHDELIQYNLNKSSELFLTVLGFDKGLKRISLFDLEERYDKLKSKYSNSRSQEAKSNLQMLEIAYSEIKRQIR